MKIQYLVRAVSILVLGFALWLAWEAHQTATAAREEVLAMKQRENLQLEAGAVRSPTPFDPSTEDAQGFPEAPNNEAPIVRAPTQQDEISVEMTESRRRLAALPTLANVIEVIPDQGFVVINAGTDQNLAPGMRFQVRRESSIIGTIQIGDTIEPGECVADIVPGSLPAGVVIRQGDDIVQNQP